MEMLEPPMLLGVFRRRRFSLPDLWRKVLWFSRELRLRSRQGQDWRGFGGIPGQHSGAPSIQIRLRTRPERMFLFFAFSECSLRNERRDVLQIHNAEGERPRKRHREDCFGQRKGASGERRFEKVRQKVYFSLWIHFVVPFHLFLIWQGYFCFDEENATVRYIITWFSRGKYAYIYVLYIYYSNSVPSNELCRMWVVSVIVKHV